MPARPVPVFCQRGGPCSRRPKRAAHRPHVPGRRCRHAHQLARDARQGHELPAGPIPVLHQRLRTGLARVGFPAPRGPHVAGGDRGHAGQLTPHARTGDHAPPPPVPVHHERVPGDPNESVPGRPDGPDIMAGESGHSGKGSAGREPGEPWDGTHWDARSRHDAPAGPVPVLNQDLPTRPLRATSSSRDVGGRSHSPHIAG